MRRRAEHSPEHNSNGGDELSGGGSYPSVPVRLGSRKLHRRSDLGWANRTQWATQGNAQKVSELRREGAIIGKNTCAACKTPKIQVSDQLSGGRYCVTLCMGRYSCVIICCCFNSCLGTYIEDPDFFPPFDGRPTHPDLETQEIPDRRRVIDFEIHACRPVKL